MLIGLAVPILIFLVPVMLYAYNKKKFTLQKYIDDIKMCRLADALSCTI